MPFFMSFLELSQTQNPNIGSYQKADIVVKHAHASHVNIDLNIEKGIRVSLSIPVV